MRDDDEEKAAILAEARANAEQPRYPESSTLDRWERQRPAEPEVVFKTRELFRRAAGHRSHADMGNVGQRAAGAGTRIPVAGHGRGIGRVRETRQQGREVGVGRRHPLAADRALRDGSDGRGITQGHHGREYEGHRFARLAVGASPRELT